MKHARPLASLPASRAIRGLSLVELMIAMVLGLVVLLGVMGVISANGQNYRATEALSELQENARTAFELMAREIRQAADTGCGPGDDPDATEARLPVSVHASVPAGWWRTWAPLRGFDGATVTPAVAFGSVAGRRINDTHALQIQSVDNNTGPVINHNIAASIITTTAGHPFRRNDVMVVCDNLSAEISLLQNEPAGGASLTIGLAGSVDRINNAMVSRYSATTWYVGDNDRDADGGRSLYRARLSQGTGAAPTVVIEEVLPGVQDMQLRFRGTNPGGQLFDSASAVTAWNDVNAVEIELTLVSTQANVASDAATNADRRLQRTFTSIVALRNRIQ